MDIDAYIKRLYSAFSEAPRPVESEVTPHRCGECDEVSARLAAHESGEVPDQDMYWLGDSLPLLGPKAFRYYLPNFIAFSLKHRDSSLDGVINYNLAPSASLDEGERNRFASFTRTEAGAISEFVEFRANLDGASFDRPYLEQARQYWVMKLGS